MEHAVGKHWRKATYSQSNGGACVEVGSGPGVLVRDTTARELGHLEFSAPAWNEFLTTLK
jgi:hypothetical protein